MNIDEVKTATTQELVVFYNANSQFMVKKFSDRATAERRVNEILGRPIKAESKAPDNAKRGIKSIKSVTIGSYMTELIVAGALSDKEIFEKTRDEFSANKIKLSYVSYYRTKLKKDGEKNV